LAYHNAQLQASAFREEYDPETFEDLTEPKFDMIHKVSATVIVSVHVQTSASK
jgi:ATP-dependent DNA helicase 2 subunit 1